MKVVHIITGLDDGGAEHTLYKICKYDKNNVHLVISLKGPGKYFDLFQKIGIRVYCLDLKFYSIYKLYFLIRLIYLLNPNIVQTWLVHGDFIGGITARFAGIKNIVWNIRYSNFEKGKTKLRTILIVKLLTKLSFFIPKSIITVSKKAKKIYNEQGYESNKIKLIPNGYDLLSLRPDNSFKVIFRKKLNISQKTPLIGNIARYDPKKDHSNLLNALSLIRSKKIKFFCVLVGTNINENNIKLTSEIKRLNLCNYIKLLDQSDNILEIMNGLDVYVQSSSFGEGFPNVVAEAMACGTPCVVTDVGDASFIVGDTGWVVPPKDSLKLSISIEKALLELGSKEWNDRFNKTRLRIENNFSLNKMIDSYNKLWTKILETDN